MLLFITCFFPHLITEHFSVSLNMLVRPHFSVSPAFRPGPRALPAAFPTSPLPSRTLSCERRRRRRGSDELPLRPPQQPTEAHAPAATWGLGSPPPPPPRPSGKAPGRSRQLPRSPRALCKASSGRGELKCQTVGAGSPRGSPRSQAQARGRDVPTPAREWVAR